MKTLFCDKCNEYLGEIERGKIHKRARILCEGCARVEQDRSTDNFWDFIGAAKK